MGLFWQKARFCTGPRLYIVVFAVDDVLWPVVYHRWQFIDVNIDRGGCWGLSDAESWFRAETYYIRILNVSPVFAESVFLMTRVFAESVFLLSQFLLSHQFCWVRCVFAESVFADKARYCWVSFADSVFCWQGNRIRCGNVLYTYNKSFAYFDESVVAESDIAESDKVCYCSLCIYTCLCVCVY